MDPVVLIALVMAASFWILTQANIIWTKNALSKRVIKAGAETKQQAIDTVVGMETRVNAQLAKIDAVLAELPDVEDMQLDAEALAAVVGPIVSTHMEMAFRQVEAQQAKRTGQFLKEMGVDEQLRGMEEGMKAEALAEMGPQAAIMMEILETKIPKKASVVEKLIMQSAKAQAAKMLQGMAGGTTVEASPVGGSGSFGVR